MADWFRSWHGAPTDPKWLGIARRAGIAPGIAVAIAWALMDRASQSEDRGSIHGFDAEGLAYFFGCEPDQVDAVVAAMTDKGMISEGRFTSWEKRQPKREDDSAKRVREHRERNRQQEKRDVTHCNAPDTDTDTEVVGADAPTSPEPEKSAPVADASPTVIELPCVSGEPYPISEADVAEWRSAFPAVDVRQQLAAARQWLIANPTRRKTRRGMRKFVVSWLDRRQNSAPPRQSTSPPRKRNFADVAIDRWSEANGSEIIFGNHGDVELLPPGSSEPRFDDENLRSGSAWFSGRGDH